MPLPLQPQTSMVFVPSLSAPNAVMSALGVVGVCGLFLHEGFLSYTWMPLIYTLTLSSDISFVTTALTTGPGMSNVYSRYFPQPPPLLRPEQHISPIAREVLGHPQLMPTPQKGPPVPLFLPQN